eukprot:11594223-Ditylum_brightwellii.AAC.1
MGPRRQANPPIATVIKEGDKEDEEEEDIAHDLYSIGSEGRMHATASSPFLPELESATDLAFTKQRSNK